MMGEKKVERNNNEAAWKSKFIALTAERLLLPFTLRKVSQLRKKVVRLRAEAGYEPVWCSNLLWKRKGIKNCGIYKDP